MKRDELNNSDGKYYIHAGDEDKKLHIDSIAIHINQKTLPVWFRSYSTNAKVIMFSFYDTYSQSRFAVYKYLNENMHDYDIDINLIF